MVLRSWPRCRAIAEIDQPRRCSAQRPTSSSRVSMSAGGPFELRVIRNRQPRRNLRRLGGATRVGNFSEQLWGDSPERRQADLVLPSPLPSCCLSDAGSPYRPSRSTAAGAASIRRRGLPLPCEWRCRGAAPAWGGRAVGRARALSGARLAAAAAVPTAAACSGGTEGTVGAKNQTADDYACHAGG